MLQELRAKNPGIKFYSVLDPEFAKFGRVIDGYDFTPYVEYLDKHTEVPEEGNKYVASVPEMEALPLTKLVEQNIYAGMPAQVGYCNGNGSLLNALEFHKCNEINVGVSDMVLLLYSLVDVVDNKLESKDVIGFYVPAGTPVELHATTLHYAPCKVMDSGFKCLVILTRGTNGAFTKPEKLYSKQDELLFGANKWLIGHPEGSAVAKRGGYAGILGPNVKVNY
ncbi:MAG: DUF4867 family protein [Oscillospiraceae bacterium]|jgi:hypothetical protein|nr:DUF4867 family protein [Oscillospiraceae bacterium]